MLEGIPKRDYPKLFYHHFREFLDVLAGKTSLKIYLTHNFPSLYRPKFKEGEILKWKEYKIRIPQILRYDPLIFEVLSGSYSIPECHVEKGDIVIDAGAHFGFFSYHAVERGAEEVHAFEPNPYVFEILKKHIGLWKIPAKPYNVALMSFSGFVELFISDPLSATATVLKERDGTVLSSSYYTQSVRVRATALDEFVEENGIERVDFIKIDTEGAEREIIKGAEKTIREFKPRMAIASYHLPDDKKVIPELVLSIRDDYKYKLVKKVEENLFFY